MRLTCNIGIWTVCVLVLASPTLEMGNSWAIHVKPVLIDFLLRELLKNWYGRGSLQRYWNSFAQIPQLVLQWCRTFWHRGLSQLRNVLHQWNTSCVMCLKANAVCSRIPHFKFYSVVMSLYNIKSHSGSNYTEHTYFHSIYFPLLGGC